MGVDYKPISGVGVEVTESELEKFLIEFYDLEKNTDDLDLEDKDEEASVYFIIRNFYEWNHEENNPYRIELSGSAYTEEISNYYIIINDLLESIDDIPSKIRVFQRWLEDNGFENKKVKEIRDIYVS